MSRLRRFLGTTFREGFSLGLGLGFFFGATVAVWVTAP